jgi:4-hydroxyphenylacetate 3-monooxygenase
VPTQDVEKPKLNGNGAHVKTGEQFKEALRDGRQVYYKGERIEDVTDHPATAGGIDLLASLYDAQHSDAGRDLLTYTREDGERVSAAYMVTRTKKDLTFRREGIEFVARETFGVLGRGIDMIGMLPVGMVGRFPTFFAACPEYAENIHAYREYAEANNIHLAEAIVDAQGFRSRAAGTSGDTPVPDRAVTRITKEDSKGIYISGVKAVGTACPQANEVLMGSFHPTLDDESFWAAIPLNSPGVKLVCRELVHHPGSSPYDHPLDSRGEEIEALMVYDNAFIPHERIFSMRARELHSVNFYDSWARHEHWYTFVRVMAKAEMLAGLAQLIVDTLELGGVPVVRQRVGEILQYAQVCRGMAIAAEELAELSEGDVMCPNENVVTAARAYALEGYPWVMHTLQDLCGQGLVLRFSEADFDLPAAFGKDLSWFLDTRNVSAKEKNLIMNLVWDVTGGAHAGRVKLFEESNALNVPLLRERLYGEYERGHLVNTVRAFIGLAPVEERGYEASIHAAMGAKKPAEKR